MCRGWKWQVERLVYLEGAACVEDGSGKLNVWLLGRRSVYRGWKW